ncbi:hypothetical protein G4B88_028573 [Cannabis sativa]|uniref:Uncharacterized protein n=1 Tax=Cannabis sativa TaxID=3483 RepID=A0A7J6F4M1_CANSA|nr:hypothetical protein G4B88_028573 [Cannabis sativa]
MAFTNAKDDCLVKLCNNKNPEAETSKTAVERSVWEEKAKKWRRTSLIVFVFGLELMKQDSISKRTFEEETI